MKACYLAFVCNGAKEADGKCKVLKTPAAIYHYCIVLDNDYWMVYAPYDIEKGDK
jgi:hypothetical protein